MAKTREIKKRIKAVGNIRRITKTMQMIATSKFARAQAAAVASKPYSKALGELLGELARAAGEAGARHPLLETKGAGRPLTLVITSDRGLCGPYNGAVLRTAMQAMRQDPSIRGGIIEVIGKKGLGALKFNGVNVAAHHASVGDRPSYETARAFIDGYVERFIKGEISSLRVVSMRYISAGKQTPAVTTLLPFAVAAGPGAGPSPAERATQTGLYEFSPAAAELLAELIPAALRAEFFQLLTDAVVSEHIARMVAMKAATDNSGKMGKALTRKYNRARQAQITTELTEIISGAAALGS